LREPAGRARNSGRPHPPGAGEGRRAKLYRRGGDASGLTCRPRSPTLITSRRRPPSLRPASRTAASIAADAEARRP
jgi:hypothetical protein